MFVRTDRRKFFLLVLCSKTYKTWAFIKRREFIFHSCDYNTFSFYILRMWWESKKDFENKNLEQILNKNFEKKMLGKTFWKKKLKKKILGKNFLIKNVCTDRRKFFLLVLCSKTYKTWAFIKRREFFFHSCDNNTFSF